MLSKVTSIIGICFLCFVWGVAAASWNVFPHQQINRVQAGIDALQKMEDSTLPQHVIAVLPEAAQIDPVQSFGLPSSDELILMTGGFFYRQDKCPAFGCMAFVMNHDGAVLHSWEFDPSALFTPDDFKGFTGYPDARNLNVQGVTLDQDGNLIVIFQGRNVFPYQIGIAKFSWDSKLLRIKIDNSHHWPTVGKDGRIYAPIARIDDSQTLVAGTQEPLKCKNGAVFQDGVQILSPDGELLKEFWMENVVEASDMQGLAFSVRNDCDPYHVNGIDLLNAAAVARIPGTRVGDLLVSLRASSALVVLDQDDGRIKHIVKGPMVAQHSPRVLPDGDFAVFDNLGGIDTEKGTRVIRVNSVTGLGQTIFPRDPAAPGGDLDSNAQGAINFSADGSRVLVAETLGGRVFEVDTASGKTVWQYEAVSDLAPFYTMIGEKPDAPTLARMQTQGAAFLARADFDRLLAAHPD